MCAAMVVGAVLLWSGGLTGEEGCGEGVRRPGPRATLPGPGTFPIPICRSLLFVETSSLEFGPRGTNFERQPQCRVAAIWREATDAQHAIKAARGPLWFRLRKELRRAARRRALRQAGPVVAPPLMRDLPPYRKYGGVTNSNRPQLS